MLIIIRRKKSRTKIKFSKKKGDNDEKENGVESKKAGKDEKRPK